MKRFVIKPENWSCTLAECPAGFFMFNDQLCLKTEYVGCGPQGVYGASGEVFWGGAKTGAIRQKVLVMPVKVVWEYST